MKKSLGAQAPVALSGVENKQPPASIAAPPTSCPPYRVHGGCCKTLRSRYGLRKSRCHGAARLPISIASAVLCANGNRNRRTVGFARHAIIPNVLPMDAARVGIRSARVGAVPAVDINGTGQRVCVVQAGRRTRTGTKTKRKNSKSADEKNSHSGRNDNPSRVGSVSFRDTAKSRSCRLCEQDGRSGFPPLKLRPLHRKRSHRARCNFRSA